MRRRALIGSSVLLADPAMLASARGVIEIFIANHRPSANANGPEPGFMLTLAAELFRMIGLQVVFRFLPWPEAEAIAPQARAPAREAQFLWAVALFDDPSGLAAIQRPPPDTLAEARHLPRIGVLSGSPHEAYLRERGVLNLVPMPDRPAALAADGSLGEIPRPFMRAAA